MFLQFSVRLLFWSQSNQMIQTYTAYIRAQESKLIENVERIDDEMYEIEEKPEFKFQLEQNIYHGSWKNW